MTLHRLRRLTLSKSMHLRIGRVKRPARGGLGRKRLPIGRRGSMESKRNGMASILTSLAADRNSGKGEEHGTPYRLPKHLRRGKNAKEQGIFQLRTGLGIRASGDDLIVVHPAFSVDESLNHDRVVRDPQRHRRLERGIKKAGTGSHAKRFVTRQQGLR